MASKPADLGPVKTISIDSDELTELTKVLGISESQVKQLTAMSDPEICKRSANQQAQAAGINTRTWYRNLHSDKFKATLQKRKLQALDGYSFAVLYKLAEVASTVGATASVDRKTFFTLTKDLKGTTSGLEESGESETLDKLTPAQIGKTLVELEKDPKVQAAINKIKAIEKNAGKEQVEAAQEIAKEGLKDG